MTVEICEFVENGVQENPPVGFFEGREKLLEVWFKPTAFCPDGNKGLRVVTKDEWSEFLTVVKCTILSSSHNEYYDSYVLSESSLFVSPYRVLLKTCGTTTLLPAVPKLMALAKEKCGLTEVVDIFYSRNSFLEPEKQDFPHTSFEDEAAFLDTLFDGHGSAYVFGSLKGDNWYLYTLDHSNKSIQQPDQTLEILMSDLDPVAMRQFYKQEGINGKKVTKLTGISNILPGAVCDEALFDPCGYSVNALLDEAYFTIHVTPQPECSYVSFETN
eukprot:Colp12_sorted_trinity150504_noHs@22185